MMLQAWGEGYSLPPEVQTLQAGLGPSHGCPSSQELPTSRTWPPFIRVSFPQLRLDPGFPDVSETLLLFPSQGLAKLAFYVPLAVQALLVHALPLCGQSSYRFQRSGQKCSSFAYKVGSASYLETLG